MSASAERGTSTERIIHKSTCVLEFTVDEVDGPHTYIPLLHRTSSNVTGWEVPGGKPDGEGEDTTIAAIREIEEETGIKVPPENILRAIPFNMSGRREPTDVSDESRKIIPQGFRVAIQVDRLPEINLANGPAIEHDAFMWVDMKELFMDHTDEQRRAYIQLLEIFKDKKPSTVLMHKLKKACASWIAPPTSGYLNPKDFPLTQITKNTMIHYVDAFMNNAW